MLDVRLAIFLTVIMPTVESHADQTLIYSVSKDMIELLKANTGTKNS